MKKFLAIIVIAFMSVGCYDDSALWDSVNDHEARIVKLETLCNQLNTNITSLQTIVSSLQNNDFVTGISPIMENGEEVGYMLTFSKSGNVSIYHGVDGKDGENGKDGKDGENGKDGKDASIPVIGVRQDYDGVFYWTLNGEWILSDDGKKIPTTGLDGENGSNGKDGEDGIDGTTPKLKIEEGYWYISYDNGYTWNKLDVSQGEDGDSMFSAVIYDNNYVYVTLAGEETILTIPRYAPVSIYFNTDNDGTVISAGETITINYEIEGASDNTTISASSDGNYIVKVVKTNNSKGVIHVTCPEIYVNGYINVIVNNGYGYSILKVINFSERKMLFSNGLEFNVNTAGGLIEIPFVTNFDFTARVDSKDARWIKIVETKAERAVILTLQVDENIDDAARKGHVYLSPSNSNNNIPFKEIIINQSSAYFSMNKTSYVAPKEGGECEVVVNSSRGLTVQIPNDIDWLTTDIETNADETTHTITFITSENTSASTRGCDVMFYSSDGSKVLGTFVVMQSSPSLDELSDMIFEVRANFANDFTVYLPITNSSSSYYDSDNQYHNIYPNLDCYIDWGDGNIEHIKSKTGSYGYSNETIKYVTHKYEGLNTGSTFTVKISGIVESLSASSIPSVSRSSIQSIKQWGKTGLKLMDYAFNGNQSLKSLPSDNSFAFAEVVSFINTFSGCTGLESIPAGLFKNCRNVNTFSSEFYDYEFGTGGLFGGCINIKEIPDSLFKNCTNAKSFSGIFAGCTSLKNIPENTFNGCINAEKFEGAFYNCTSLASVPDNLFKDCEVVNSFYMVFRNCKSLQNIPESLFSNCPEVTNFNSSFSGCSSLTSIPAGLFKNNTKVTGFSSTFYNCSNISIIPSELFGYCPNVTSFASTFNSCSNLINIPNNIFDNNRRVTSFYNTFYSCYNVVGESPYTIINGVKYHLYERSNNPDEFIKPTNFDNCFSGCSKLSDYQYIPNDWK